MQPRIPEVTLFEEVGRGPGGVVFRGTHRGSGCTVKLPSDRPVALNGVAISFEQDVLMLARLSRAGMPRVLQLGSTRETPYAILDEAKGEPLPRVLRRSVPETQALRFALSLSACLQELHEAGFVHGCLTPEYILLSEDGARVSLLDRGTVARAVPFDAHADTQALGLVLRACVKRVKPVSGAPALLERLADELICGERIELGSLIAELEVHALPSNRQHASYPPPSRESLPIPAPSSPYRRPRSEITQLRRFWERASEQRGRAVEVLGPAGSGKSRLLAAFADQVAGENVQVLSVKCRDSDWAPFSALKRLLEGHLAGLEQLEPRRRMQIVSSLRAAAGPMASRIRLLSPRLAELFRDVPDSISEGDAQQVFIAGMADFLAEYLEWSGPSVLIIDDAHWLDGSSRMVLSRLAARICPRGHLLLCGARDDVDSREPLERLRAALPSELIESVQLGSLCERDARDLIGEYLGLEQAPGRELVAQLAQLSDGTPLSLIELLRLTLERGFLKPHAGSWRLEVAPVQRMRLPASSQLLIERRLADLDRTTARVLRAAAVIRSRVDLGLLTRVTGLGIEQVRGALDPKLRVPLLEVDRAGGISFVHDSVWEALLRGMPLGERRALHERVAEALYEQGGTGAEYEYDLARHHAAGIIERNPRRAYEALRRAAQRAIEACDDALALTFLKPAEEAARLAAIDPDRSFYVDLAETSLRRGAAKESLGYFEQAVTRSQPGFERAHARARIAWLYHHESNASACWSTLQAALGEFGRAMPEEVPFALLRAAVGLIVSLLGSHTKKLPRGEAEALCGIYAECTRVCIDNGRVGLGLASIFQLVLVSRSLPPCRAVVQADLFLSFALCAGGFETLWRSRYARAEAMARQIADPIAQTMCHQIHHVIAGWRGDMDECERQARISLEERGHWMEIGDVCHMSFAMYGIEIARGRLDYALAWAERAIERVRQAGHAPAVFSLIEDAARTTLTALGRNDEIARLERRLQFIERAEIQDGSFFHLLSYQNRIQRFTEPGDLGPEFEELVSQYERLGQDPRRAHPSLSIYYTQVAHARIHQCLRASPQQRAALLPKLDRAVRDVELLARTRALSGHARFGRAAERWFSGASDEAELLLTEAERVAQDFGAIWITYASARLRAHMLRAQGKESAARDQARIAALIAQQYGLPNKLRFVREEFELAERAPAPAREDGETGYSGRHLAALLHISQANSRELGPERQARLILDELIMTLGAERAFLFMRGDPASALALQAARTAGERDLEPSADYDHELVEKVYATGQTQLIETEGARGPRVCIAAALVLREQAVGVLYLDRPDTAGEFVAPDVSLLQALANQVPIALELGRALQERERLQQNLRQAQKMEALGRLAGGIAHDFNNILAAIQIAAHGLELSMSHGQEGQEDVEDIMGAARRGSELTRALLALSRGKEVPPRRIILGQIVHEIIPMLHRLVHGHVRIDVEIAPEPLPTMADPSQIERVLMNLVQNASDAMPSGGLIAIRVGDPTLIDDGRLPVDLQPGTSHALLMVSDNGSGMNDEVRARLFEPFFTTKSEQRGTGLGLANVYAIVQQCGGHIEVTSELGVGSTFRIYLPRSDGPVDPISDTYRRPADDDMLRGGTVLVVDEDEAARRQTVGTLERAGFQVLVARDGESALRVIDSFDGLLDLAVIDAHTPDMSGAELANLLLARDPDIKLLFVADDVPADMDGSRYPGTSATFVQKPCVPDALLAHVEGVLGKEAESAHSDVAPRH